jgi:8-oxo-dGTP pyrophosphatase MutT (NUDIX family)
MIEFNIDNVSNILKPVDDWKVINPMGNGYQRAAVLMPLIWHENQWCILFTKRTETLPHHKGQISFPGGMYENEDKNMHETALRETEEELGISRDTIQTLGRMDDFAAISGVIISPYVGILLWPQRLNLSVDEVSHVIIMPANWLANPANCEEREYMGHSDVVYYRPYQGEVLWGITARLTRDFLEKTR